MITNKLQLTVFMKQASLAMIIILNFHKSSVPYLGNDVTDLHEFDTMTHIECLNPTATPLADKISNFKIKMTDGPILKSSVYKYKYKYLLTLLWPKGRTTW